MANPIKAIKSQRKAQKILQTLEKIKKHNVMDYKWFGLACCSGMVDMERLSNPWTAIEAAKKQFDFIKTEEELDAQLVLTRDVIQRQSKRVLGDWYTSQVFKGL